MKKLLLPILALLAAAPFVYAQDDLEKGIIGKWNDAEKKAVFEIYEEGGKYFGKIVGLTEETYPEGDPEAGVTKHDRHNPDDALKSRPVIGIVFFKDFKYDGEGKWSGGTVYDPETGKTYKGKASIDGDELSVRGFIGFSLIGRTEVWTRVK